MMKYDIDQLLQFVQTMDPLWWILGGLLLLVLGGALVLMRHRSRRREEKANLAKDAPAAVSIPESGVIEAEAPAALVEPQSEPEPVSLLKRLSEGLSRTRKNLSTGLERIFSDDKALDDDFLEELEELLITSDMGVKTSMTLIENISRQKGAIKDREALLGVLKSEILALLPQDQDASAMAIEPLQPPRVIMVIGVNGVGKTTTIGKIAARLTAQGQKVLLVAADTFRAAAVEQLTIWAERAGADLVKHRSGADPSAVTFDGLEAAKARGMDVVLVDTAGRLHTKVNLMDELKKIKRTMTKVIADAPHEILLVLDATTGQNAMAQVEMFHQALDITGLVMTKLDGTAKGGIVISICHTYGLPLKYIGVGESIDALQDFDPREFVNAIV